MSSSEMLAFLFVEDYWFAVWISELIAMESFAWKHNIVFLELQLLPVWIKAQLSELRFHLFR